MGGVLTDAEGRTSVDGLWAAGEVTSTGVHGANRLASNSLLEAVVFAARIAENIKGMLPEPKTGDWGKSAGESDDLVTVEDSPALTRLRKVMSAHAGVVRDRSGLKDTIRVIAELERENSRMRFHNIVTTAKMIAVGAYLREESRGGHFRSDFPEQRKEWKRRTYMTLAEADEVVAELAGTEEV
jgi:L-aspartate oxidase